MIAPSPIPLILVTGRFGAGKTTLINALLATPALAGTLVIENEPGETVPAARLAGLDDDDLAQPTGGCLCCTLAGAFPSLLENLLRRRDNHRIAPFTRVIVETAGQADPAALIGAVLGHPYLSQRYSIGCVVAVIDGAEDPTALPPAADRQIDAADMIVVTKLGVGGLAEVPALHACVVALNSGVRCVEAQALTAAPEWIVEARAFDPATRSEGFRRRLYAASMRRWPPGR